MGNDARLLRDDRGMGRAGRKPLVIADYDPAWPDRFSAIGSSLRGALGDAVLRIDHIGSTAVAGLPAKDLIDVQVTVRDLVGEDAWAEELLPGSSAARRSQLTTCRPAQRRILASGRSATGRIDGLSTCMSGNRDA